MALNTFAGWKCFLTSHQQLKSMSKESTAGLLQMKLSTFCQLLLELWVILPLAYMELQRALRFMPLVPLYALRRLYGHLAQQRLPTPLGKGSLLFFFSFLQFTSTFEINQNVFLDDRPITLHFTAGHHPTLVLEGLYKRYTFRKVSSYPVGDVRDIIDHTAGLRCTVAWRQQSCDASFSSFEKPIGRNAVFFKYDHSDVLNSECGLGTYFECLAVWVKRDYPLIHKYEQSVTCLLRVYDGNSTNYLASETSYNHGGLNISFGFACPGGDALYILGNGTHVYPRTPQYVSLFENGYVTRNTSGSFPNRVLEIEARGDLDFHLFSEHSYELEDSVSVSMQSLSYTRISGPVFYQYDQVIPVKTADSAPRCEAEKAASAPSFDASTLKKAWAVVLSGPLMQRECVFHCWENKLFRSYPIVQFRGLLDTDQDLVCRMANGQRLSLPAQSLKDLNLVDTTEVHSSQTTGLSSSIKSTIVEVFGAGTSVVQKVLITATVVYILGPKYPILVAAFVAFYWNLLGTWAFPFNDQDLEITLLATQGLSLKFESQFAALISTLITSYILVRNSRSKFMVLSAALFQLLDPCWFTVTLHTLLVLSPYYTTALETWTANVTEKYETVTNSIHQCHLMNYFGFLSSKLEYKSYSFNIPIDYIQVKLLQALYGSPKKKRCYYKPTQERHNVRNMKGLFFYPQEYQQIRHIISTLRSEEISYIYYVQPTIAGREPFDLSFLNFLNWRHKVRNDILLAIHNPQFD